MRFGGSPAKGGKRERDVCRQLSLWVTNGESADVFWRSASSGARATRQLKAGKVNVMQSGDICAVDPRGYPFVEANFVEIKHRKDLSIARGFLCETGDLARFWRLTCEEAAKYGKRPLLIAKQNLYPTLAVISSGTHIFEGIPVMVLPGWGWCAEIYLFDAVTEVPTRKLARRVA